MRWSYVSAIAALLFVHVVDPIAAKGPAVAHLTTPTNNLQQYAATNGRKKAYGNRVRLTIQEYDGDEAEIVEAEIGDLDHLHAIQEDIRESDEDKKKRKVKQCSGFMPAAHCPRICKASRTEDGCEDCSVCNSNKFMPQTQCLRTNKCTKYRFMPIAKCAGDAKHHGYKTPAPEPSEVPTLAPSDVPAPEPSEVPTLAPSDVPTPAPSDVPTLAPSTYPTPEPSQPSSAPTTTVPTPAPSQPSVVPATPAPSKPSANGDGNGGTGTNGGNAEVNNNGGNNNGGTTGTDGDNNGGTTKADDKDGTTGKGANGANTNNDGADTANNSSGSSSSGISGGAIAGIVIGCAACAGAVGFFIWKKKKDQSREQEIFGDAHQDPEAGGGDYAAM